MRRILLLLGAASLILSMMVPALVLAAPKGDKDKKDKKVKICHVPPGNPDNAHYIEISKNALKAHIAHGDKDEFCKDKPPDGEKKVVYVKEPVTKGSNDYICKDADKGDVKKHEKFYTDGPEYEKNGEPKKNTGCTEEKIVYYKDFVKRDKHYYCEEINKAEAEKVKKIYEDAPEYKKNGEPVKDTGCKVEYKKHA